MGTVAMLAPLSLNHAAAQIVLRDGRSVTVRPVGPGDEAALQDYFRALSDTSRYSRTLGAARELPAGELRRVFETDIDHHSLLVIENATQRIVGEARLAHELETDEVEISLSVADRWQHGGLGTALFAHLMDRAARFGTVTMYGDTLRTNAAMIGLARKHGFALMPTPGDWRLVRFYKVTEDAMKAPEHLSIDAAMILLRER